MRILIVAALLLLGACGGDDDAPADADQEFLAGWPDLEDGPVIDGHPTKIDEAEKVLYVADCDVARAATSGGEFDGYGYICP